MAKTFAIIVLASSQVLTKNFGIEIRIDGHRRRRRRRRGGGGGGGGGVAAGALDDDRFPTAEGSGSGEGIG